MSTTVQARQWVTVKLKIPEERRTLNACRTLILNTRTYFKCGIHWIVEM